MKARGVLAAMLVALAASTATPRALAQHTFDLADKMPPRLSIMFTMAWFGIDDTDPQSPGLDPGYANWKQNFPACGLSNDPSTCADFKGQGMQRSIASRRRPMAGIYSASGQDAESKRRIDFMLSMLRRPCANGARLDAWAVQLDSINFTSKYPANKQAATWDIAYRAQVAFLERADLAKLSNAVVIANDATVYWHFGDNFGLTTQSQRLAMLQKDIVDMVEIAMSHPSSVKIDGKPLFAFYVDSPLVTVDEWKGVLDGARSASGQDFYALGTTLNATYFGAFDALSPWLNLGLWNNTSSITELQERGKAWSEKLHAQIRAALPNNPGRVMFGGVTPGFDDYTQNWGACQERVIPRDPKVMAGQFDYLASVASEVSLRGLFFETWDDWTEGSEIEPDVEEGPAKLLQTRQLIGKLFGEADDASGDQALVDAWTNFGQARNCCFAGGACPAPGPAVDLTCPSVDDGGVGGSAGTGGTGGGSGKDGGSATAGGPGIDGGKGGSAGKAQNSDDDGGCGCRSTRRSHAPFGLVLVALALLRFRRARAEKSRRCVDCAAWRLRRASEHEHRAARS